MTTVALDLVTPEARESVQGRLAAWCRQYDRYELHRITGAAPATCRRWREGHWPEGAHLMALAAHFGQQFLEDVFAPLLEESEDDITARLDRIEADAAAVRRAVAADAGAGAGAGSGAAVEARAPAHRRRRAAGVSLALALVAFGLPSAMPDTVAALTAPLEQDEPVRARRGGRAPRVKRSKDT